MENTEETPSADGTTEGERKRYDWPALEALFLTDPEQRTLREFAEAMDVPLGTMKTRATRGRWMKKRRTLREQAKSEENRGKNALIPISGDSGESDTQPVVVIQKARGDDYERAMARQASRLPRIMAQMSDTELLLRAGDLQKLDTLARRNLGLDSGENSQRAPLVQIALLAQVDRETVHRVEKPVASASESTELGRVENPS